MFGLSATAITRAALVLVAIARLAWTLCSQGPDARPRPKERWRQQEQQRRQQERERQAPKTETMGDSDDSDNADTKDNKGGKRSDPSPESPSVNPLLRYFQRAFPGSNFDDYYHVLVTGPQNSGKTSLVCLLRHLFRDMQARRPMDESLDTADEAFFVRDAPTVENDRRDPTPYRFGTLVLWDLPGAGTPSQPVEGYVQRMGLHFASHVVVTVGQTESEVVSKVVQQMTASKIPATIAQTHIDVIVEAQRRLWRSRNGRGRPRSQGRQFSRTKAVEDRIQDVRNTYSLDPCHFGVYGVNLAAFLADEEDSAFRRDPFELFTMLKNVVNETYRTHTAPPATAEDSGDSGPASSSSHSMPAPSSSAAASHLRKRAKASSG